MIDFKKQAVQQDAVNKCLESIVGDRFTGTCEIATGTGKTFIAFWLINKLKPKSVLFLAETTLREKNIHDDLIKFQSLYNIQFDCEISFACYQTAYKWTNTHHEMVVADEIHDSLTPEYFKFYQNNSYKHLLGLSATIDSRVYTDSNGVEFSKLDMLNRIAPIVFKYTMQDGIDNETSRRLNIIIIRHHLDSTTKNVLTEFTDKATGKKKTFYQTEQNTYDYYNQKFLQTIYQKVKNDFLIRYFAKKRSEVLYTAPSKIAVVYELLKNLDRTIVFGNDIDSLSSIVPTVSSRNKPVVNNKIISDFNNGLLNVIGSFKMLKQGINLSNLDNVIFHSYYGVEKDTIQRIGRLRKSDSDGFVFIILTVKTQEQNWFNRMITPVNSKLIWCDNVQEAISVWKKMKAYDK